jgi:gamma-glutamylcyclotransferase (GGCT)/AIG2-like uncharacterized protein YtfP
MKIFYFTYGSLKRGYPNHQSHEDVLSDFVGAGVTSLSFPLVVPDEPNCTNPHCPYLHRMPTLLDMEGVGMPVQGEVFRLDETKLKELDKLEGFIGPGNAENIYERRHIDVRVGDQVISAQVYFIVEAAPKLALWRHGLADVYEEYTLAMAATTPKPIGSYLV